MSRLLRFSIELCPPQAAENISNYYEKIEPLLQHTNLVSISSHPSGKSVTGFERSVNLAKYLLTRDVSPKIDILLHVTCRDINRANIKSRLKILKDLKIKRLLVISGENYRMQNGELELCFANSSELVYHIKKYYNWFESIAVGGYPRSTNNSSAQTTEDHSCLYEKVSLGADTIYTQCVFDSLDFKLFRDQVERKLNQNIEIVPSVAIFSSSSSLSRCLNLMRVQTNQTLFKDLDQLQSGDDAREYCKNFLVRLCLSLWHLGNHQGEMMINLCTFGLFDFVKEVIQAIEGHNSITYRHLSSSDALGYFTGTLSGGVQSANTMCSIPPPELAEDIEFKECLQVVKPNAR